jgi:glycerol-3-phosphate dehydrogenase
MVRDLRRLADTRFDALVVGAGIYGVATAWDLATRGLSVALIDRGDIGGGTSFNNFKTLHGGLRSLQSLNLTQMRRFIRERRALARIAPHLIRTLPFVVPTVGHTKRSRFLMMLALALNDAVADDRNDGISDPALKLPRGRVVSREEALGLNPVIAPEGVTGGAVWYDYQMTNADRVTLSFALSAVALGAVAANHVEATHLLLEGNRVGGMRVEDRLSGSAFDIRARVVVNAAGAWAPALLSRLAERQAAVPALKLSRAMNLVVRKVVNGHACGGMVDGRFLFLVPWRDVSMVGTSHDAFDGAPDGLSVSEQDLDNLLTDARAAFPRAALGRDDVRMVHRGLLPMVEGHGTHVKLLRESAVVDHAVHGVAGLVSIHGVRYTTARDTAENTTDTVFLSLGQHPPICQTAVRPLLGGDVGDADAFAVEVGTRDVPGVPAPVRTRLARIYGTACAPLIQLAAQQPSLVQGLGPGCDVTGVEIVYAARHEMAMRLSDALLRRTEAGSAGHPGAAVIARAAELMRQEHAWTDEHTAREIADVEAFYTLPG